MTWPPICPLAGFSVTIPHKQKVMRYLDIIDPLARRIGAVNTVWKKAGKWRGTNTDAEAITGPLSKKLRLAKSSVLLAGNGGAARSAAYALIDGGRESVDCGTQSGSRPLPGQGLRRGSPAAGTSRIAHVRRAGARHAAGHVSARRRMLLREKFRRSWCSTWCTTRSRRN